GTNTPLITEVIPELELITGVQPKPESLPPAEAQNRFNRALLQFVTSFARPEMPLVIFLDDLQWADKASLTFIQSLMGEYTSAFLLLIGAYRDNEVGENHPLSFAIRQIENAGEIDRLSLEPLKSEAIISLLSDTLRLSAGQVASLGEILENKTLGNPFYIRQF